MSLLVEKQGLREIRRYLDYGKRIKDGAGLEEFYQWLAKILLDGGQVYAPEEQALAFEIGAGELLADQWAALNQGPAADLVLNQPLDKSAIYRLILQETAPITQRTAFLHLLGKRYKKHYNWIEELALRSGRDLFVTSSGGRLFNQFLHSLDEIAPLPMADGGAVAERFRRESQRQRDKLGELQKDVEFAKERAERAHKRLKDQDEEMQRLKKQLREERENGEKLRSERKSRIKSQRQSGEAQRDLDHLRREYLKLDGRLKEMANRLAVAEGRVQADQLRINIDALRHLNLELLLGVRNDVYEEQLGKIRRRFAAAFHPDRAGELPKWVGDLFVEVLGLVNEACDRAKNK